MLGTREEPWAGNTLRANTYYGSKAVKALEKKLGQPLDTMQKRVVGIEGYVPGYYLDTKGILTFGVGQTGKHINEGFIKSYDEHFDRAEDIFGEMGAYPEELQGELLQLTYRGDAAKKHNWVAALKKGHYKKAAENLLIHREYMDYKKEGVDNSITKRLEDASKILIKYDQGFGDE